MALNDLFKQLAHVAFREIERQVEEIRSQHGFDPKDHRGFAEFVRARAERRDTRNAQQTERAASRMMADAELDDGRQVGLPTAERCTWAEISALRNRFRRNVARASQALIDSFQRNINSNIAGMEKRCGEASRAIAEARLHGTDWWDPATLADGDTNRRATERGLNELAKHKTRLTRMFIEEQYFRRELEPRLERQLSSLYERNIDEILAEAAPQREKLSIPHPFNKEEELANLRLVVEQTKSAIELLILEREGQIATHMAQFEASMRDALTAVASGVDPENLPPEWRISRPIPFETLRARYSHKALLLFRPYPPHRTPTGRSRLGGLPDLPPEQEWPRTSKGAPLHFLAQIDLAEMPQVDVRMPCRGTLLFFALMSEELLFDGHDQVRVLYDPDSSGRPVKVPAKLEPIDASSGGLLAVSGHDMRTYPSWPLLGAAIESLPLPEALPDHHRRTLDYAEYTAKVLAFRADQVTATTGHPPVKPEWPSGSDVVTNAVWPYRDSRMKPFEASGFPWLGLGLRVAVPALEPLIRDLDDPLMAVELRHWFEVAAAVAPEVRIDVAEGARFIAFLDSLLVKGQNKQGLSDRLVTALKSTIEVLVLRAGESPSLAAVLPDTVYEIGRSWHVPVPLPHQMFGYVQNMQGPLPADANTLTLLQLQTDYGAGLVIGDAGELDFRIEPDDLSGQAWSKVLGAYSGG